MVNHPAFHPLVILAHILNMSKSHAAKNKEPPPERLIFARNFKRARHEAGLTQQEIRAKTGFAQPFISKVENGQSTVNLDNAAELARAVGQPLWMLLQP
jgi:DNA-binding XRE family transcriptional regulator